jgi:hypothetical protein
MRVDPQFRPPGFAPAILVSVCFLLIPDCAFAQQSAFDEEIISKWKAYEIFSRSLQGTVSGSGTLPTGKSYNYVYHYKQNRECTCFNRMGSEPSFESWFISNPGYAAEIKRSKESPSDVILLNYAEDSGAPIFGGRASVSDVAFAGTSPHFSYGSFRLSELAFRPEFKAKNKSKEQFNGRDLVRVDYVYDQAVQRDNLRQITTHGFAYFDPSRSWCIDRIQRNTQTINRGKVEMDEVWDDRYETTDHSSGFPLIKRQIHSMKRWDRRNPGPAKESSAESTIVYEFEVNDHVPDTEFTLSAFGLPEPRSDTVQKTTPLYIWILLGAAVCALLAFGFRYLARRRRLVPAN